MKTQKNIKSILVCVLAYFIQIKDFQDAYEIVTLPKMTLIEWLIISARIVLPLLLAWAIFTIIDLKRKLKVFNEYHEELIKYNKITADNNLSTYTTEMNKIVSVLNGYILPNGDTIQLDFNNDFRLDNYNTAMTQRLNKKRQAYDDEFKKQNDESN